ncbi:MAG: hypothetical protein QXP34_01525 [Candidatus Aenigmatarchaeota archaeon]
MKTIEIILVLIFSVFGLVLLLNYIFGIKFIKFESEELTFLKKEDFLFKINELVSNCLNKKTNKREICYYVYYKGLQDVSSEEILSKIIPENRNKIKITFEKLISNEKIIIIYVPFDLVEIVKYSEISK